MVGGVRCAMTGVKAKGMYVESNRSQSARSEKSQHSSLEREQIRCANCDIDILWPPTMAQGKTYCCAGFAAGGPCSCDYSLYSSVTIAGVIHYGPGTRNDAEAEQG